MQKNTLVAVIVGIVVIVGVIGYQLNETAWNRTPTQEFYEQDCGEGCDVSHVVHPENPQNLYGLQINKDKYLLGENIFVKVSNIPMELKTQVIFYTPNGKQFYEIPIDGEKTSGLKQYFKPQLLANRGLCNVDELIGLWTVMFENNPQEVLKFEMTGEYLPNNEKFYLPETCGISKQIQMDPGFIPPVVP